MSKQDELLNDFSEYFLDDTSAVDIDLPNGEPMLYPKVGGQQVRVRVYGPSTKQYQKAQEVMSREATKRVVAAMGNKRKQEAEDQDADIKFLVAITAEIENFPYPGGPEAVYRNPKLKYVADQVRTHVGDTANFFGTAPSA
jgi:predicted metalloprotease